MRSYRFYLLKLVFAPIGLIPLLSSSAIAAQAERNVQIPDSSIVNKVEIVLTPKDLQTRFPWREQDLYSMGCRFTVSEDRTKINDLITILRDHVSATSSAKKNFSLRNAVYLYLHNGTRTTLLFSDANNSNMQVYGVIRNAENAPRTSIAGDESTLDAFRKWASSNVSKVNFSESCLQN